MTALSLMITIRLLNFADSPYTLKWIHMKQQIILLTALPLVITACGQNIEDAVTGEEIYASCTSCHGAQGEKHALGVGAIIAGQNKDELTTKMKGYIDGTYGGSKKAKMTPKAAMLSDEQIVTVSEYISTM